MINRITFGFLIIHCFSSGFSQTVTKNNFIGGNDGGEINFFTNLRGDLNTVTSSSSGDLFNALFFNPSDSLIYAVLDTSGSLDDRNLFIVNPFTGDVSLVHDFTEDYIHTADLGENEVVYAVAGNAASVPGRVYALNLSTGVETTLYTTLATTGGDPRAIEYNPKDSSLYVYRGYSDSLFIYDLATGIETRHGTANLNDETHGVFYDTEKDIMLLSFYDNDTIKETNTTYNSYVPSTIPFVSSDNLMDLCRIEKSLRASSDSIKKCPNDSVLLSTVYPLSDVSWYNGSTKLSFTGDSIWVKQAGNYSARIRIGATSDTFQTESIVIENFTSPVFSITQTSNDSLICPGDTIILTGVNSGTRQWYKDGVAISGETGTTLSATTVGIYNQTKTNMSGCVDSSQRAFQIFADPGCPSTSLNEITNPSIRIYPNPSNIGRVIVESSNMSRIELYLTTGELISSTEINNKKKTTLDLNELNRGLYLFKIIYIDGSFGFSKIVLN